MPKAAMRGRNRPAAHRGAVDASTAIERHLLSMHRRGLRPSTITQRGYALQRFDRHLKRRSILRATHDDVLAYIDHFDVDASRATELSHLKSFYRWAALEGIIARDPTLRIDRPRLHRRLPRPMPEGDLRKALDGAPDRIRPWLWLAAYAGLRAIEIANLRGEGLLFDADPALIVLEHSKGGHMRAVPMAPLLAGQLRAERLPRTGWCFPHWDHAGPVNPWNVSGAANRYLHGLGITHTLHTIRHYFATEVYRQTHDLRITQELLGHQTPVSTQIYTYVDPVWLAAAVAMLPPLL